MKTLYCSFDIKDLYKEAEGCAWDGWFCPVWAHIEDNDIILSLGGPVSKYTTFVNNEGQIAKSWVGNIPCWYRYYGKDDAKIWAEDNGCDPDGFDSDLEMEIEVGNWELEEELKELEQEIVLFAKAEGYDEVEFC